eukprot:CAMPEP_0198271610 /NCGR_PEP_ID=MMETSP1447-20131203/49882_1 /TAXON_ID=420782 /ORGANISM="Chaetoceros dichaeta, Strain CCMP1751" /LENGTH=245 /DNA_ID=CAMNT_0043964289 /DNA_START=185 /DNA_END=919 /DNA_ORIENTATION=-
MKAGSGGSTSSTPHHQSNNKGKEASAVLPLVIYQTASPHVFISSCALDETTPESNNDDDSETYDNNNDDDSDTLDTSSSSSSQQQPAPIHPKELFTDTTSPPQTFQKSRFEYVSPKLFEHQLPTNPNVPEVAFLGRSNVGKSSLINAITHQKALARISKRPGRTQQVNYFALVPHHVKDDGSAYRTVDARNGPIGYLIDLPGYGYGKAPEETVDAWQAATQSFLLDRIARGTLTRLYFLVDARRG